MNFKKSILAAGAAALLTVSAPLPFLARAARAKTAAKAAGYHCPMHPSYHSDKPGNCPICGMTLVPDLSAPAPGESGGGGSVPGQGTVSMSAERRRQIGVVTEAVRRRDLAVVVRATGQVAYDPDLYHAINEYGESAKAREAVKNSPYPDILQRADALVQAADLRLRQMGLSQAQIEQIATSTQAPTNLLFGGPGGTVWVYAQVYEYEIPLVKPGQSVELATLAYPGRKFHGTVRSLDPILSAETRSLRARIEVPNPEGLLSLQMYADAGIRAELGRKLALPTSAVVDTGARKIVFVEAGDGRFEPREVQVGRQAEAYYEVLSGLKEGEKVVTSGNFLIDSESKLRAVAPAAGKDAEGRR